MIVIPEALIILKTRYAIILLFSNLYLVCRHSFQDKGVGDVCSGDSGGGFIMEVPGEFRWVLTGIVSFGVSGQCDKADEYTLFTNVGRYYGWIDRHTSFSNEEVDRQFLNMA